jgi:hypothetical protein
MPVTKDSAQNGTALDLLESEDRELRRLLLPDPVGSHTRGGP